MKWGSSFFPCGLAILVTLVPGCDLPELPPEPKAQPIQTSEPETILRGTPDVETTEREASFDFTCDQLSGCRFECRMDDQPYFACESPAQFESLAYGQHQFFVRAIDDQNRTDTTPASFTWLITKDGAGSHIDSLEVVPLDFNEVTAAFSCGVANCSFKCQLDDNPKFDCESPLVLERVSTGSHQLKVQAYDLDDIAVPDSDTANFEIEDFWKTVSTKSAHTCALRTDGKIFCWGLNFSYQLGNDTQEVNARPVSMGTENSWQTVKAGARHTCALKADQSLWCWGANRDGNLATGEDVETLEKCDTTQTATEIICNKSTPHPVAADKEWLGLSVGWQHTCAIDDSRLLYCWGKNANGQTGNASLKNQSEPYLVSEERWLTVAAGVSASCGIQEDHTLHCWGLWHEDHQNAVPILVNENTDWAHIAAGGAYDVNSFCAIKDDASLWCFGDNHEGILGLGSNPSQTSSPQQLAQIDKAISVSVGASHGCSVSENNKLWCWGQNDQGQIGNNLVLGAASQLVPQLFNEAQNWQKVTAGLAHNCALTTEGKLYCWGRNHYGATGTSQSAQLVTGWDNLDTQSLSWIDLAAAGASACAIKNDKSLWCWGKSGETPLGNTSNFHLQQPAQVGVFQWESLSAGGHHACGIQGDKSLHCWGQNDANQVSSGDQTIHVAPTLVSDANWESVSVGQNHACGIHDDGDMFCWGLNTSGQTGQTPGDPVAVPTKVGHESIFYQVSSGASHTCALDAQKSLFCWGSNDLGQLGVATSATEQTHLPQQVIADSVTAFQKVAVGHHHACAIDEENALWCWGQNDRGQCGANAEENSMVSPIRVGTLNSWQHVAAGKQITCAIRQGGSLFCWGAVIFDSALPELIEFTSTPTLIDSNLSYATVTVGDGFFMGLDENGKRYGRGQNQYGQLGNDQAWTFAPEMINTTEP